jgi:hypothetical protein
MPKMPEIVGETAGEFVDEALEVGADLPEQDTYDPKAGEHSLHSYRSFHHGRYEQSGILRSPFGIRLADFSGEGERAPPE